MPVDCGHKILRLGLFFLAACALSASLACRNNTIIDGGILSIDVSRLLSVGNTALTVTEGGASDNYTLKLSQAPRANVTLTLTCDSQVLVNGSTSFTVTFTPQNWNIPQTLTVTAVDDGLAEGNHSGFITHSVSSTDNIFSDAPSFTVQVSITDNDVPGVSIAETAGSTAVTEGGATDTYTVVLTSQPLAAVTVNVSADAQGRVNGGASAVLTFLPGNWNITQTVTVSAFDDASVEGAHTSTITHSTASADAAYNALVVGSVTAAITDNDTADVSIVQSGGSTTVTEGGATDTYTVVLTSQPTATVTVTVTADAQTRVNGGATATLTFLTGNWNTTQTITVSAVDDFNAEGLHNGTITHSSASGDANYNGLAVGNVTVAITDNDTAGASIVQSGGSTTVTEAGATDTYTVVLTSQPTATVTVTVTADAQTRVNGGATATLTFLTGNWNTAQTITVSAVNDLVAEGTHNGTITHSAASADTDYNGVAIGNVTATITDNDTAGVSIVQSGGTTNISEAGVTDTYTVVLTSQPTATVTVTVTADAQTRVNGGATATLTFLTGNWNTTQTVTVSAVNDAVAEGMHSGTITHSAASADATYNGIAIGSVTATITDNDAAGITLSKTSVTVFEGGANDSYTVVLTSQPTANVTVTVTADAQTRANAAASAVLTFTTGNWNSAQTVTVSAVNDAVQEGPHSGTLTQAVASSDTNYNAFVLSNISAQIVDDDLRPYFVDAAASGSGNGYLWPDAYTTIAGAASAANTFKLANPSKTVEVWVKQGTYKATAASSPVLTMPNNVAIYGGFIGNETSVAGRAGSATLTILDGDFTNSVSKNGDSCPVVRPGTNSTLDSFVVQNGTYNTGTNPGCTGQTVGGGIALAPGTTNVMLRNLIIQNNSAVWGNGLGLIGNTSATVVSTKFLNNSGCTGGSGGAIAVLQQGATSNASITIVNSLFDGNNCSNSGGAIVVQGATATIVNSSFRNNTNSTIQSVMTNGGNCNGALSLEDRSGFGSSAFVYNSVFWGSTYSSQSRDICSAWQTTPNVALTVHNSYYNQIDYGVSETLSLVANIVSATNPFQVVGTNDYLAAGSTAIDAGSNSDANSAVYGYPFVGLDWTTMTTRSTLVPDSGTVDMGMHY